ncbi:HNH endonuclease signature motif containing protein [Streptomyces niger]|uniref:HNH endonuclease signature motif containing protein n=1 Tax=Streptomyces niger TaxID=66373 RepID=UPI0018FE757B|nr:HNH endonuclease signature motif containing protein [Streptomyces niger]
MASSIPPELAIRVPRHRKWITVDDLVARGWTTRMIERLGEPDHTETTSQGGGQAQFSRSRVLSRWKKPGVRREVEAAQARYRFLRNVIGQLDAPGATFMVAARTVVVETFTHGDLRIRIGDPPPYEHRRRISVLLHIDGESPDHTDALYASVSEKLRQARTAAGATATYHPRQHGERSAAVQVELDRPYGAAAKTKAPWGPHGRDLPWVVAAANMFRIDLAPLLVDGRGRDATSGTTAVQRPQQVAGEAEGSRLGADAGSGARAASGAGSAAARRCSVCGDTGLADGRSRHLKCEGSRAAAVASGVVPPSDVDDASDSRDIASDSRDVAPDSRDVARYRQLVSSVEQREAATRGCRVERVNREIVRLGLARQAVLLRCGGRCENPGCGGQPADVKDDGRPILEVDHVKRISEGGRDHPVQMVALCPNCHAMKEHGRQREALIAILLEVAEKAHARW